MNHARRMMDAMVYGGGSRIRNAWLMYLATYTYTRSWDGGEGPDGRPMSFGRWYSFKSAVRVGWYYLWK